MPNWNNVNPKVHSLDNLNYRPSESAFRVPNEKLHWNSESRLKNYFQPETSEPIPHAFLVGPLLLAPNGR